MSFINNIHHIVFATKKRRRLITADIEREIFSILFHILKKNDCHTYRIGGFDNHVHLLLAVPATTSISEIVQRLKRESSVMIREKNLIPQWDGWQEGYGCFSCSRSDIPNISEYIKNQRNHHKTRTFLDEYRAWLIENGVSEDAPFFP